MSDCRESRLQPLALGFAGRASQAIGRIAEDLKLPKQVAGQGFNGEFYRGFRAEMGPLLN